MALEEPCTGPLSSESSRMRRDIVQYPRHYHNPVPPVSRRAVCPICKKAAYSPAGIHPQCAMSLPDTSGQVRDGLEHEDGARVASVGLPGHIPSDLVEEGRVELPAPG